MYSNSVVFIKIGMNIRVMSDLAKKRSVSITDINTHDFSLQIENTHARTHAHIHTHTHTHTHIYIYIYIYICKEREKERECVRE